jgi:carbon-monoxide dehydrogenase large subunit
MDMIDYAGLRRADQARQGPLMGIGISSFTEIVGIRPSKHFDSSVSDVRLLRDPRASHRQGHRPLRRKSQGQGHETTYAQILAEELGIPAKDIKVEEGDTDTAPYGLGTYASRSTPVAGAPRLSPRARSAKARKIAAHLLEVAEEDLEWEPGEFSVKGSPGKSKAIRTAPSPPTRITPGWRRASGGQLLRSAEPPSVRQLHLRGRRGQRHG